MNIFSSKKKKWWQYTSSENLSTREQLELFILILAIVVFAVAWYHFYINSPRIEDNASACSHRIWEMEQRIQRLERTDR